MPADKDWTSPAARRELAALHAAATPGPWHAGSLAAMTAAVNALPALLARIERDAALLARAAAELPCLALAAGGAVCGRDHLCRACALLADLQAAGFAPEGE